MGSAPDAGHAAQCDFRHGQTQADVLVLKNTTADHEKRIRFIERAFFIGSGVVFLIDRASALLEHFRP